MSWLALRFKRFDDLIKGHRSLIVEKGEVFQNALQAHCVINEDLDEQLRLKKIDDPTKVETAFLERSGEISVIPRE